MNNLKYPKYIKENDKQIAKQLEEERAEIMQSEHNYRCNCYNCDCISGDFVNPCNGWSCWANCVYTCTCKRNGGRIK